MIEVEKAGKCSFLIEHFRGEKVDLKSIVITIIHLFIISILFN